MDFAWPVLLYHLLLALFLASLIFVEQLSVVVAVAFAPGMIRAAGLLLELGRTFPIRRLGWSEVAHAVFFAVALVLALQF